MSPGIPSQARGPVALTRIGDSVEQSVHRALELSDGLAGLKPGDRVLVKPNLVGLATRYPCPPYGVVSTTVVTEALIRALRDAGAGPIALGDGSLINADMGTDSTSTMAQLGYQELARRYDLTLVDLNHDRLESREVGGLELKLSETALNADFLVSLPVLKTHTQCKASLSLKNLKGCLNQRSKAACHDSAGHLEENVAQLALALWPDLALVDGRYALARGPLSTGKAQRADLILASADPLDADLAAAAVLGLMPGEVTHLAETARLLGRPLALPTVVGDHTIDQVRLDLPWDWPWTDEYSPEPFLAASVKGVMFPKYDHTLCTGCSYIFNPTLVMTLAACQGRDLDGVEVLFGKRARPSGRARASILMGNCVIKHCRRHQDLGEPILAAGCPPTLERVAEALNQAGIAASVEVYAGFAASTLKRYPPEKGFLPADFQPGE